MNTDFESVRKELISYSEESIAELSAKLNPTSDANLMIGIRIGNLRKIAKQIVKNDWQKYLEESKKVSNRYFEEIILEGLVIGYAKTELDEKLKLIEGYIPNITSWAINDTFCPTIKIKKDELEIMWNFIQKYLVSEKEFEVRFAVIMMLDNFIIDDYVDKVIKKLDKVNNEGYYAKMAVAWTMAEIGIKYNEKAMAYLKGDNNLDDFTYNKTLQKMRESFRIPKEQKEELKKMKRE